MNKQEITELVAQWGLTSESAKSCVNRLESALTKTGSASSRLSMVGSSLLKLSEQAPADDAGTIEALGNMAKFFSHVAVDNKKQADASTPAKKRKTGWEGLKPADATPAKPRKAKQELTEAITPELLEAISRVITLELGR